MPRIGNNGGLMGVRRVPGTGEASGIWDFDEQSIAKRAGIWPATGDPYWNNVSLLLPMNNGFQDIGPNSLPVTAYGNAQISSAQGKWSGTSGYFGGSGYINSPANDAFKFGFNDFTIEMWHYLPTSGTYPLYETNPIDSFGGRYNGFVLYIQNGVYRLFGDTNPLGDSSTSVTYNSWVHFALVRSNNVGTYYINGVSSGTASMASNYVNDSFTFGRFIDSNQNNAPGLTGYINDLRVTKAARYNTNFAPPTSGFPVGF